MTGISRVSQVVTTRPKLAAFGAVLTAAATLGALAVGISPAAAANAGCGSSCDGQDPDYFTWRYVNNYAQQCGADAETIATASAIELRYSPLCRTAWARAGSLPVGSDFSISVTSYNASGSQRKVEGRSPYNSGYTLMVNDAGLTAKACITWTPGADSGESYHACTKAL